MIRPLSLYIGLRYTRAKRRNGFISFISLASMLGIAIGVAVLITVLSVMNGFDYEIKHKFFAMAPEVTVFSSIDLGDRWHALQQQVDRTAGVRASAPFVNGKGMLSFRGQVSGVEVMGVLPKQEAKISALASKMVEGSLNSLQAGRYNMVLGYKLADNLGLRTGDKLVLLTPETTSSPLGIQPRYRQFTVSGVFDAGGGFGFDNGVAYINLTDAEKLFRGGKTYGGLHVKIHNIYQAGLLSRQLAQQLPPEYLISTWMQQYGAFFKALAMEKTMMFIILILIVAVAAFNLVSTLVMVVNDKQADIAILRTLGARPRSILFIFIFQGAIIGLIGLALGVIFGLLLADNASALVSFLQDKLHMQLISASVYMVDYLPVRIIPMDIVKICIWAFGLCLLATLYPAYRAYKTQPAEALRYE